MTINEKIKKEWQDKKANLLLYMIIPIATCLAYTISVYAPSVYAEWYLYKLVVTWFVILVFSAFCTDLYIMRVTTSGTVPKWLDSEVSVELYKEWIATLPNLEILRDYVTHTPDGKFTYGDFCKISNMYGVKSARSNEYANAIAAEEIDRNRKQIHR